MDKEQKLKALQEMLTERHKCVYRVTDKQGRVKYTTLPLRRFGENKRGGGWNRPPVKLTVGVGSALDYLLVTKKDLAREKKVLGIKGGKPSPLTEEKAEEKQD